MVKNRFSLLVAALMVLALIASQVLAQHELYRGPPRIDPNGYEPDLSQPFIEPLAFDPDFQFLAPAGVDRLGGEIDPSIGWFSTFDKTYLFVSRPQDEPSGAQLDDSWGNRLEIGYMTAEDHGWFVSFLHVDGPNNFRIQEVERLNVFLAADTTNSQPNAIDLRGGAAGGGGTTTTTVVTPGFPVRDRNDPITLERDYRVHESVNNAKLSGFELNKSFRFDPLHYGSIMEPFFGFKYNVVNDLFQRDVYERFDDATGAVVYSTAIPGLFPPQPVALATINTEQFTSVQSRFNNNMFGAQVGTRWYKQKSRWNLSSEVRAFALQNFQSFNRVTSTERTIYSAGTGGTVSVVLTDLVTSSGHSSEFVFGMEVRSEAAYSISKNVTLRVGIQLMDFARGIGRGNDLARNDQDFILVGATGGFTVNR